MAQGSEKDYGSLMDEISSDVSQGGVTLGYIQHSKNWA
jgi:hypothetical protein